MIEDKEIINKIGLNAKNALSNIAAVIVECDNSFASEKYLLEKLEEALIYIDNSINVVRSNEQTLK